MRRYFFYALVFPAAFMNLLLVQASPSDLFRYFLAGYVVAAFPAVAIALLDQMLSSKRAAARAGWCALAGLLLAPVAMGLFIELGLIGKVQAALSGGLAAFLCTLVFERLQRRTPKAVPKAAPVAA